MVRRKRLRLHVQARLDAFDACVEPLERAKAALTESVPGARLPGRPLAETLLEFEEGLRETRERMGTWRIPEVEPEWRTAAAAIEECLATAERLRLEADAPKGFEALIGVIGDLLAPLEAFEATAERFRALRA